VLQLFSGDNPLSDDTICSSVEDVGTFLSHNAINQLISQQMYGKAISSAFFLNKNVHPLSGGGYFVIVVNYFIDCVKMVT